MRMLMRSSTVADVLLHLAQLIHDSLNTFEPSVEDICHVFEALGVPFDKDKITADGHDFLLHGTTGMPA